MTGHAMRVRMLRGTGGPDGLACEAGGVYDLPRDIAVGFVVMGRAVPVDDVTEHGAPVVVHGDAPVVATRPAKPRRAR